jgi:uncharacterized protein (TIGR02466 family)
VQVELLFPSAVIKLNHPEFLNSAREILPEYLSRVQPNEWNVCQSESMHHDKLTGLLDVIAKTSFEMLSEQGYNMIQAQTNVAQFWGQEFTKHGQHIEHVHPFGAQVSGFYFVDVPDADSAYPVFFDPRHGKRQINMPQLNQEEVTYASEHIIMAVQPGDLLMSNSWLPHGFTRHQSESPLRFIHFVVNVEVVENKLYCDVEII